MSAPKAGRNSPPPSDQSDAQQSSLSSGSGKINDDNDKNTSSESKDQNKNDTAGLPSNPKGPLEDAAREKLSKGGRGDV